jgi:hypothetical protein
VGRGFSREIKVLENAGLPTLKFRQRTASRIRQVLEDSPCNPSPNTSRTACCTRFAIVHYRMCRNRKTVLYTVHRACYFLFP